MAVAHWRIGCSLPTTTWETLPTSWANSSWNSVMSACGADIMEEAMAGCAGLTLGAVVCGNWRVAITGADCDCGSGCCVGADCVGCACMGCAIGTVGLAGLKGVALCVLSTVPSSSPSCSCGCVGRLGAWNAGRACGLPGCCGLLIWRPMEPSWVASSFSLLIGTPWLLLLIVLMIGCDVEFAYLTVNEMPRACFPANPVRNEMAEALVSIEDCVSPLSGLVPVPDRGFLLVSDSGHGIRAFLGRIDFWFPGSGDHANLPIASGTGRTGDVGNIQCAVSWPIVGMRAFPAGVMTIWPLTLRPWASQLPPLT